MPPAIAGYIIAMVSVSISIAAADTVEISPDQIVERYIELSIKDPEQSRTLLVPDAAWILFDHGGDLAEIFPWVVKLLPDSDCSKPLIQTDGKIAGPTGAHADVVRVEWKCAKPSDYWLASNVMRFFVFQQKIGAVVVENPPGYPF